jgi:nucleolar protein 9
VARSLIANEQELAASFYGKFFARNLNLYLLRRRPDQWRDLQSSRRRVDDQEHSATLPAKLPALKAEKTIDKRKRKNRSEDEIDVLFGERLGKKTEKAVVFSVDVGSASPDTTKTRRAHVLQNGGLEQNFGAIRSGPKK